MSQDVQPYYVILLLSGDSSQVLLREIPINFVQASKVALEKTKRKMLVDIRSLSTPDFKQFSSSEVPLQIFLQSTLLINIFRFQVPM